MLKSQLAERVKSIEEAVERSMANHNALIGRLQEAKEMLSFFADDKEENVIDDIKDAAESVPEDSDVQEQPPLRWAFVAVPINRFNSRVNRWTHSREEVL